MEVNIQQATELLQKESIVAIPTETVYGLAARYDSESAIKKIFHLKKRPLSHPLIVHINKPEWLNTLTNHHPEYVKKLIRKFWPGPLTLVLPKSKNVNDLITAGQPTVAIRIPSHPTCLQLLTKLNVPIVAPSANPYCRISPTNAQHVVKYFPDNAPILDGGPCSIGIESTIVLATNDQHIQILRPGIISQSDIESTANVQCIETDKSIKAPGNKKKHYAPDVPLLSFSNTSDIKKYLDDEDHSYFF
ncbi:MAG: threonylcarbamoyl-AMP synthase, partial [Gammaproteobacteria bacterium]|nr:threonylcarbamoyl-AMP synthase [Gammaproteobacteria bacterium]